MAKAVLVTGSRGDIGQAIATRLSAENYQVIGLDLYSDLNLDRDSLNFDLATLTTEERCRDLQAEIESRCGSHELAAVVNNAATQIVAPFQSLTIEDIINSLQINCVAAFGVARATMPLLCDSNGAIVNIGSIHSKLTKPSFISYSTSKSALEGLTRAMAVELGHEVKVCCISPAAIETRMLAAGLQDNPEAIRNLRAFHPSRTIGEAAEVACLVSLLISSALPFANGAIWQLDGGISHQLHDPQC